MSPPSVAAPASLPLPDGWADITSRSQLPQVDLWLVNQDYSGSMVLSEMQDADSALVEQDRHDPCLAANISLLSKFSGIIEGRRVTRTPFILDSTNHLCGYVYIEKGLLRRVLVFVKKGKLFELELFQEKTDASFERLSEEQLKMVRTLMASQE